MRFNQKTLTVILSGGKNLAVWGATGSGDVYPTSSEESESAPIPIKVADRSLVDLLGKDSSPKSRSPKLFLLMSRTG